jgi:flagellar hook-length control protein FliK
MTANMTKQNTVPMDLMSELAANATKRQSSRQNGENNFGDVLERAVKTKETPQQTDTQQKVQPTKTEQAEQPIAVDNGEIPKEINEVAETEAQSGTETVVVTEKAEDTNEALSITVAVDDETELLDVSVMSEALLAQMAQILNVTPEQLETALRELGLTLADLTDKTNVTAIVALLNEVDNPVKLLEIQGIQDVFKQIDSLMQNPEFKQVVQSLTARETVIQPVTEQTNTIVTDEAIARETQGTTPQPTQGFMQQRESSSNSNSDTGANAQQQTTEQPQTALRDEQPVMQMREGDVQVFGLNENQPVTQAPPVTAVTPPPMPMTANAIEVINQIAERIRVDVTPNVSEVRMTLRPESLGELTIRLRVESGIVIAQFVAESERVRQIIESNFNELRDALTDKGLEVSQMEVSVGQDRNQSAGGQQSSSDIEVIEDAVPVVHSDVQAIEPDDGGQIDFMA